MSYLAYQPVQDIKDLMNESPDRPGDKSTNKSKSKSKIETSKRE